MQPLGPVRIAAERIDEEMKLIVQYSFMKGEPCTNSGILAQ